MAAEAGWRVSRYLLQAEIPGSKNVAIYNTYRRSSGEYTPLDLYIMSVLDEVPEGNPFIARLAKGGLIVKFDEREALEAKRRLDCSTAHNGTVAVTICPTMACNFECPYCFASLGQGKMSPRVQDDVVSLVARMIDSARATKLNITWFGGEPLLATDVIEALSPRLIEIADKRGCAYESWIFTNGYLISPEVVEMFRRCRIGKVHIPLDGVGATNDATRRLRGGGPTFDRIMDNLGLLKPPLKTLVRANTHEGNVSQLDDLKALVMSRAAETGNRIDFYVASLIDVSPRDELNSPMAE